MSLWYLLFDGSSCDGRGTPEYVGRTSHEKIAKKHFDEVESSSYCFGNVMIASDFDYKRATKKDFS